MIEAPAKMSGYDVSTIHAVRRMDDEQLRECVAMLVRRIAVVEEQISNLGRRENGRRN